MFIVFSIAIILFFAGCLETQQKYPSVSKISIKFEEYKFNFAPAQNINSAFGSLHVKNDNDVYIVVKLNCVTNDVHNVGCEQVSSENTVERITEIEGRKIDGDIIQPHENKLLSFKVYATDNPIRTGNFMLKLNLFADRKCPYELKDTIDKGACSSEQNDALLGDTPIYLTIT
jgi:hypothetical protein